MSQNDTAGSKASLFDIRNIIGALLGIYGVVLVIVSFAHLATPDLAKVSTGSTPTCGSGSALLLFALFFMVWALLRPIVVDEEQLEEDKRAVEEEAHRPHGEGRPDRPDGSGSARVGQLGEQLVLPGERRGRRASARSGPGSRASTRSAYPSGRSVSR